MKCRIISIGYGRHLFTEGNKERLRMEACARKVDSYHLVVFVKPVDRFHEVVHESGLVLHPVTSRFSLLKVLKAIKKVRQLISSSGVSAVIVSTQDPFETGF